MIGPSLRCGAYYAKLCVAACQGYACWGSSACRSYRWGLPRAVRRTLADGFPPGEVAP